MKKGLKIIIFCLAVFTFLFFAFEIVYKSVYFFYDLKVTNLYYESDDVQLKRIATQQVFTYITNLIRSILGLIWSIYVIVDKIVPKRDLIDTTAKLDADYTLIKEKYIADKKTKLLYDKKKQLEDLKNEISDLEEKL